MISGSQSLGYIITHKNDTFKLCIDEFGYRIYAVHIEKAYIPFTPLYGRITSRLDYHTYSELLDVFKEPRIVKEHGISLLQINFNDAYVNKIRPEKMLDLAKVLIGDHECNFNMGEYLIDNESAHKPLNISVNILESKLAPSKTVYDVNQVRIDEINKDQYKIIHNGDIYNVEVDATGYNIYPQHLSVNLMHNSDLYERIKALRNSGNLSAKYFTENVSIQNGKYVMRINLVDIGVSIPAQQKIKMFGDILSRTVNSYNFDINNYIAMSQTAHPASINNINQENNNNNSNNDNNNNIRDINVRVISSVINTRPNDNNEDNDTVVRPRLR